MKCLRGDVFVLDKWDVIKVGASSASDIDKMVPLCP